MALDERNSTRKGTAMYEKAPSIGAVLLHVILTLLTGGFWLIVLIIWKLLHIKKKS